MHNIVGHPEQDFQSYYHFNSRFIIVYSNWWL